MSENNNQYVVLARKYRPQSFEDLVGQDALVQTLTNAIMSDRIHHAYILTGIRGVGKTTTARIIAKALNCTGNGDKPTVKPCGKCENCLAIANGRHIDVLELDAASKSGVDNMRELLDGVRYKPTSARYKVYIIDEIHMLTTPAFNALLKTLEEPPSHVKFVFATTEIRKVPVTVLSRCQRFDLQRIETQTLLDLFTQILAKEKIQAEPQALKLIAQFADGSARDGLSLLDQAIALSNGNITENVVTSMMGLTDRVKTFELFEALVKGDVNATLKLVAEQYKAGASPLNVLQEMINIVHMLTKAKVLNNYEHDNNLTEAEKNLCKQFCPVIKMAILNKMWQMLIKGISELQIAPSPVSALEMILLRIAYSANMPSPAQLLEEIKKKSELKETVAVKTVLPEQARNIKQLEVVQQPQALEPIKQEKSEVLESIIKTPKDLADCLEKYKKMILLYNLKCNTEVIDIANNHIKLVLAENVATDFVQKLTSALYEITAQKWVVDYSYGKVLNTMDMQEKAQDNQNKNNVSEFPLVKAVLNAFPKAKIDVACLKINEKENEEENVGEDFNG